MKCQPKFRSQRTGVTKQGGRLQMLNMLRSPPGWENLLTYSSMASSSMPVGVYASFLMNLTGSSSAPTGCLAIEYQARKYIRIPSEVLPFPACDQQLRNVTDVVKTLAVSVS